MKRIKIGNRWVGEGCSVFIVAEAGVNHNGKLSIAKKLVDIAKDAGADAVKFQTFRTEELVTKNAPQAKYQKKNAPERSQFEMLKKLELSENQFRQLFHYCKKKKIMFLSTPYDLKSTDFLYSLGVSAFKISSADITNIPFLIHTAKRNLPIILSTGMSTLGEVKEAVRAISSTGNNKIILLHCNFNYPAIMEDINLRSIKTLKLSFPFVVGYSDHALGIEVAIAAAALESSVIEKHFTINKSLPGPDHRASLNPSELADMVKAIRNVESSLGSFVKQPSGPEILNRKISRRSLVARVDIPRYTKIIQEMIAVKRPGTGIPPKFYNKVIGLETKRYISRDELFDWSMFFDRKRKG